MIASLRIKRLTLIHVFHFSEIFTGIIRRVAHPLNSELASDFSGAPLFAMSAKGGCFRVVLFPVLCSISDPPILSARPDCFSHIDRGRLGHPLSSCYGFLHSHPMLSSVMMRRCPSLPSSDLEVSKD